MDKKVWAIVAIGVLQLTLMWFMRGTLKPEEMAQADQPPHPDVSPIEPNPYQAPPFLLPEKAAVEETNPATPDDLALVARRQKSSAAQKQKHDLAARVVKRENGSHAFSDRTIAFARPIFHDTVIVVKHAAVQPNYQAQSVKLVEPKAVPQTDIRPIEKRKSFIKRAGRIVLKPYDWLKTLVSKL